jgi:O-antigen ligase
MNLSARRTSAIRLDSCFAAALGLLPFLGYLRAQPMPGFWGEWVAVAVALLWLGVAGVPRRGWGWVAAAPFVAVAALMLLHLAARLVPMPVEVLVAAALLVVAAALAAHAADGGAESLATGLAAGLIAALLLNAVAVGFERAGYEWQLVSLYRIPVVPPRAVGLIGQSNHLATLGVLATAGAVYLRLIDRLPRWLVWVVALAAAFVLAASSSRAGMAVAAAVFVVLAIATRKRVGMSTPTLRSGECVALASMFVAVQLAWLLAPVGQASTEFGGAPLIARSDAGRSSLWLDALALWRAHPLLGVGHGNYAQARLHELNGPMPVPHVDHAHNLLLQVASEWGAVGLLLVALALVWLARAGLRALAERPVAPARLFALAMVVALLVHGLAEHPLWFPHYLFLFALAVGLLVGAPVAMEPAPPRRAVAIVFGLVVAAAIAGVAAADYLRLQHLAAGLRADAVREPGTPPRISLAEVASVERLTLFPRPATLLLSAVLPINPVAAEAKLAVARRAMDMIPAGQTIARWAALAVVAGRADEARALLLAMRQRHQPAYLEAREILQRSTFGQAVLEDFVAALPPP